MEGLQSSLPFIQPPLADQADIACPAACAKMYTALGEHCYTQLTKYMFQELGSTLGDDVVVPVV